MNAKISFQKKNWRGALALAVLMAILATVSVPALGGVLDVTFDGDGKVITDFTGSNEAAWAVTVQPDGKIIVVGDDTSNMLLARYNRDGSLDATFDSDGKVVVPFDGRGGNLLAVALLPDGRILVGGRVYVEIGEDMALSRFNSDGSLDPTFGIGGKVTTDFAGNSDAVNSLVIRPDGRIVAAGYSLCVGCDYAVFALAAYNSDGSPDNTFGTDGTVLHPPIGTHSSSILEAVLQPDGKLVVTGLGSNTNEDTDFTLVRYLNDGSPDLSFGTQGIVQTDFGGSIDSSDGMVLQPDGKIIVAGTRFINLHPEFALARYNSDGSLDALFGTNGRVLTDMGSVDGLARGIALQPDGKIIVAGLSVNNMDADFALARYNSDGSLDADFGTSGWATTDFGDLQDMGEAVAIQDGKVVIAGVSGNDFAVARYRDTVFADVPPDHWAWSYIELLYEAGITAGCGISPLVYCPENTITRAQMAVLLLRGLHGSSYSPPSVGTSSGFGDVPPGYWAGAWIKELAAEGITSGCGNGNYCPEAPVTRDQMAVFLLRSEHGAAYSPPAVVGGTGFADVSDNHWAAAWIKQLDNEGITAGCGGGNYCPTTAVTRAEMAVFLVRTFNLP